MFVPISWGISIGLFSADGTCSEIGAEGQVVDPSAAAAVRHGAAVQASRPRHQPRTTPLQVRQLLLALDENDIMFISYDTSINAALIILANPPQS